MHNRNKVRAKDNDRIYSWVFISCSVLHKKERCVSIVSRLYSRSLACTVKITQVIT